MKWYFWLLVIILILIVYESIKKSSGSYFNRNMLKASIFLQRMASTLIKGLMRALRETNEKLTSTERPKNYASLTPTQNADSTQVYEAAILENLSKSDVMNIALTGPYGSGKSSIICTFINKHPEYNILNISLAAINDGDEEISVDNDSNVTESINHDGANGKNIPKWSNELSQQIEYSILQQMFYHVTEKQIPYSRFKRIRKISKIKLLLISVCAGMLAISVCFLSFNTYNIPIPKGWSEWLHSNNDILQKVSWIYIIIGFFFLVYFLLGLYRSAQLIKLNLNSAQLEISPNKEGSVLNKHLDEILYFFSEVRIDIVVIEDLGRFRNPEIFVKLREINTLINNSKVIRQKVTFLMS